MSIKSNKAKTSNLSSSFFIKTILWMALLFKLFLLLSLPAASDETVISYGLGIFHSAEHSPVETKIVRLARRQDFDSVSYWQLEGGLWVDIDGEGRSSSMFGAASVGIKVDMRPFFFRNSLGVGFITAPDVYLGGAFPQFTEEFTLGAEGTNGTSIGLAYKHFSSAGIVSPNMGRDFIILSIGVGNW